MTDIPSSQPRHVVGQTIVGVPHAEGLNMIIIEINADNAVTKVTYAPHLVGDPETGIVHGGVITSLLDNTCGVATTSRIGVTGGIATLDLRIDYMKPATPGEDIYAWAECYRVTKSIAFVRGVAYTTDRDDPIASCTAAFMLAASEGRGPGANLKKPA